MHKTGKPEKSNVNTAGTTKSNSRDKPTVNDIIIIEKKNYFIPSSQQEAEREDVQKLGKVTLRTQQCIH